MGHASRREWGRAEDRWPSFWEEVRTGQCGWALPGELTQASAVPGPRLASACSPRGPPCSPPACTLPPLSCAWEAHSAPSHAPLNWNKRRHAVPVIRPSCCRSGFIGETFLFHEGISSWACLCFPSHPSGARGRGFLPQCRRHERPRERRRSSAPSARVGRL